MLLSMGSQRVRHDWATELNWKLIKISTVIPYLTSIIVAYSSITEGEGEVAQLCPTLCDPVDCNLLGFSVHGILQQEYWSGLPFPSPGDLPDPGIEPGSPALEADALTSEPPGSTRAQLGLVTAHLIIQDWKSSCSLGLAIFMAEGRNPSVNWVWCKHLGSHIISP